MSRSGPTFEWDPRKEVENRKKHHVSFAEAKTVFFDEQARLIDDPDHSDDEDRFVIMGVSSALGVLLVCHCYRQDDDVIRIISARKAEKLKPNNTKVTYEKTIRFFQGTTEPVCQ